MAMCRLICTLFGVLLLLISCCRGCVLHNQKNSSDTGSDIKSVGADKCCTGYRRDGEGRQCEVCSDWTYGDSCNERCECVRNNTQACEHVTGACLCHPQWTGTTCSHPVEIKRKERSTETEEDTLAPDNITICPAWFFGTNCSDMCSCNQTTALTCNSTSGGCNCGPGYTGDQCNQECDNTTFGENCNEPCRCDPINSLACSRVDGSCDCSAGWTGIYCNETCREGTYGHLCGSNCTCPTNASPACNPVNGSCSCITGYVMSGNVCLIVDTLTTTVSSSLSVFLAVFENPVYVCIITAVCTLLLVAGVLCITWRICRCSCDEVRNRKHRLKDPKPLVNTPIEPETKDAIAALANITTKSIRHEAELDVPTSAVYGATLDVTGKPPVADQGNYYYRNTLQQSFPSTTPLLESLQQSFPSTTPLLESTSSQVNLIEPSLDANPYYKNTKASSVSTFMLNEDRSENSQTDVSISINPSGNIYYNNVSVMPFRSSQPNIAKYPSSKDVTFDDVIADMSKKKVFKHGKTNLKKMNSRSLPNIDRGHLGAASLNSFATPRLYKNYKSDLDTKQNQQGSAGSIYDDTATQTTTTPDANVAANKPRFIGGRKAARIVPLPVAPPVITIPHHQLPPLPVSDTKQMTKPAYGNDVKNGGTSFTSNILSEHPPVPSISNIPTFTHMYGNDLPSGYPNIIHSAPNNDERNTPVAPPIANIPKQRPSDVREVAALSDNVKQHYDDTAVKSLPRQPSESVYDNIDQGPGISRQDRFASGVYAESN